MSTATGEFAAHLLSLFLCLKLAVDWVGPHGRPQSAAAAGASMEGGRSWPSMGIRPAMYNADGGGGLWLMADHGRRQIAAVH